MKVRELIQQLLNEDMDDEVYINLRGGKCVDLDGISIITSADNGPFAVYGVFLEPDCQLFLEADGE